MLRFPKSQCSMLCFWYLEKPSMNKVHGGEIIIFKFKINEILNFEYFYHCKIQYKLNLKILMTIGFQIWAKKDVTF
jgi:hypothetical protein